MGFLRGFVGTMLGMRLAQGDRHQRLGAAGRANLPAHEMPEHTTSKPSAREAAPSRGGFELRSVSACAGPTQVLHDLTVSLPRGRLSVICGVSGCGKSTLLRLLNRLLEPSSGSVHWAGRSLDHYDVRALRREVGLVVQQPRLSAGTVADNLELPVKLGAVLARDATERREAACAIARLEQRLLTRLPHELSGGERLRVALARTLMLRPKALLLDEPTAALDARSARQLLSGLHRLSTAEGTTLVIVTHRLDEVRECGATLVGLADGLLVEHGPLDDVVRSPQSEALREMLDANRAQPATRGS